MSSQIPEAILYRAFFEKVLFLDAVAQIVEGRGAVRAGARTEVQRRAGLSDTEISLVRAAALNCRRRLCGLLSS